MSLPDPTDEELIRWRCSHEATDEGTSVLQDELAEAIERRGLDFEGARTQASLANPIRLRSPRPLDGSS
jgi:hypothetical protein